MSAAAGLRSLRGPNKYSAQFLSSNLCDSILLFLVRHPYTLGEILFVVDGDYCCSGRKDSIDGRGEEDGERGREEEVKEIMGRRKKGKRKKE